MHGMSSKHAISSKYADIDIVNMDNVGDFGMKPGEEVKKSNRIDL